ncbi:MAG: DUF3667 domain-containing protein [Bacteroidota bacterium]
MNCKNCHELVEGKFCSNCGQSTAVDRITGFSLITLMSEGLFQVNRGLFFTIVALFRRPGDSVREFIEGKRKKYFKPVAYAMLLATLYVLLSRLTDTPTFVEDAVKGFMVGVDSDEEKTRYALISPTIEWLASNIAYSIIILIPFFSLATLIAFFKQGYNFFEHLVLNAYLAGHQALIYTLHLLVTVLVPSSWEWFEFIPFVLSLVIRLWTYIQFFKKKEWYYTVAFSLVAYLLFFIFIEIGLLVLMVLSKFL